MKLRKGTLLYHGTSTSERFELDDDGYRTPTGPAWFSDGWVVAKWFTDWTSGPNRRIITYKVVIPPNLFKWNQRKIIKMLELDGQDFAEEDVNDYLDPSHLVKFICENSEYDGWIIPDNYPDGSDTMICEPEQFLEFVGVEIL